MPENCTYGLSFGKGLDQFLLIVVLLSVGVIGFSLIVLVKIVWAKILIAVISILSAMTLPFIIFTLHKEGMGDSRRKIKSSWLLLLEGMALLAVTVLWKLVNRLVSSASADWKAVRNEILSSSEMPQLWDRQISYMVGSSCGPLCNLCKLQTYGRSKVWVMAFASCANNNCSSCNSISQRVIFATKMANSVNCFCFGFSGDGNSVHDFTNKERYI